MEKARDEQRPCRIIICKARQLGVSTVSEGILFHDVTTRPNTNAVVVAHDGPSSEHLFNITKNYYETWEFKDLIKTRYATRRQLSFDGVGSNMWVMTAEHPEAGHGRTLHACHFSEVALWSDPVQSMLAFRPAVPDLPGTVVIVESTAQGMGNFFEEEWIAAKSGESDYVPLFFPWYKHYEYIPCQNAFCFDGSCERCQQLSKGLKPKDEDEVRLARLGCDISHLAWRRWAIANKCMGDVDHFRQQYPMDDEECFLTTGVNAFPEVQLREVYEEMRPGVGRLTQDGSGKVRFVEDLRGPLKIYRMPADDLAWGVYFIGADPCYGVEPERGGDWAAIQVINRRNHEQVATWHGRMNPVAFADEVAMLGKFYNWATVSVETDGPGYATIGRLSNLYPRIWHHHVSDRLPGRQRSQNTLSWQTNWKRKTELVGKLQESVERKDLILHDLRTFKEMRGYSFYGAQKGYGAPEAQFDDLVMALGIAIKCESTEPKLEPYEQRPSQVLMDLHHVYGPDLTPEEEEAEAWAT